LICLLLTFFAVPFLLCTPAKATIYDDFIKVGIDNSKWIISDPNGLFSQPGDGQLYFSGTGNTSPPTATLRSIPSFTAGFFSMDFNSFYSSNTSPGNQGLGSFAALGLGTKSTSYVRMLRGRVISDAWGYFEANYFDGTALHVWYIYADATSGQLGLSYDGSEVDFFYNDGLHGWQELDTSGPDTNGQIVTVIPGWDLPPPLFISGTPGASGLTSFGMDKVEYTTAPEPSTMIFLSSGLIGLGVYGKKKFLRK